MGGSSERIKDSSGDNKKHVFVIFFRARKRPVFSTLENYKSIKGYQMKKIILSTLPLLMIVISSLPNNSVQQANKLLIPTGDSGFVTKKDGLYFLLWHGLTETKDSFWNQIKKTDTIGKYYKVKESGNYFVCLMDFSRQYTFETHILLELTPSGKLIKSERFFHSNYACCWENYYEGFNKIGNYFSLKICGCGTDLCLGRLYVFKEILPQDQQQPIPSYSWVNYEGSSTVVNSTLEFKDDQLLMHYEEDSGRVDDSANFNIDSVKCVDVKFYFKNNKWITPDSAKFDGLDVWQ